MHAYNGVLTILGPWNDLYCVGRDFEPYHSLTHVDRTTGDHWQRTPAACFGPHQLSKVPQPPGIRFLGVHHKRLFVLFFTTDPRRLWDFLERSGSPQSGQWPAPFPLTGN